MSRLAELGETLVRLGWVARRLGIAESTARKWADDGKLPAVRLADRARWFDRCAIEKLAAEREA